MPDVKFDKDKDALVHAVQYMCALSRDGPLTIHKDFQPCVMFIMTMSVIFTYTLKETAAPAGFYFIVRTRIACALGSHVFIHKHAQRSLYSRH